MYATRKIKVQLPADTTFFPIGTKKYRKIENVHHSTATYLQPIFPFLFRFYELKRLLYNYTWWIYLPTYMGLKIFLYRLSNLLQENRFENRSWLETTYLIRLYTIYVVARWREASLYVRASSLSGFWKKLKVVTITAIIMLGSILNKSKLLGTLK